MPSISTSTSACVAAGKPKWLASSTTFTMRPSIISIAAGSRPAPITSLTVSQASAVSEKKPTIVRKLVALGARRTHNDVMMPKVPSLPQIRPGRSKPPDS